MELRIKERLENYKRVLMLTKKPSRYDLMDTAKICTLGILVVGIISFVLYITAILLAL